MNQATNVTPEYPEVLRRFEEAGIHPPSLSDYRPVEMKCPYCEERWKQHYGYITPYIKDVVYCPWCSAEIPKEKVLKSSKQRER